MIDDYIKKGLEIPQLSENILKIVDATQTLIKALNEIVKRSRDEDFKKEANEYSIALSEYLNSMSTSAQLFSEKTGSSKASNLLVIGANGLIDNVIRLLACFDNSQIRRIENLLKSIQTLLIVPLSFEFDNLVEFSKYLQSGVGEVSQLINSRIPEILSSNVAELLKTLTQQINEFSKDLITHLNDILKSNDGSENPILLDSTYNIKYKLYQHVCELMVLIWFDDLPNGTVDLFARSLPFLIEISENWIKEVNQNPKVDTSGRKVLTHALNQLENILKTKPTIASELSPKVQKFRKDVDSLIKGETKKDENFSKELTSSLNKIKDSFLLHYNEWVEKSNMEGQAIPSMIVDLSAIKNFDSWKNSVRTVCDECNNFKENYSQIISEPFMNSLDFVKTKINDVNIQEEFIGKNKIYHDINKEANNLSTLAQEFLSEKTVSEMLRTIIATKVLCSSVDDYCNYNSKSPALIEKADANMNEVENLVDDLSQIILRALNTYPLPVKSVFTVENKLEKMSNLKNFMRIAFKEAKRSPDNADFRTKLHETESEFDQTINDIAREIFPVLDQDAFLRYLSKTHDKGLALIEESAKNKDQSLFLLGHEKVVFSLKMIEQKIHGEIETCEDQEKRDNLKAQAEEIIKLRQAFVSKCFELVEENFDQNILDEINEITSQTKSLISDTIDIKQMESTEAQLSVPEIIPQPKTEIVVPEKYKEAFLIIDNPQSDDRIAMAASKLHHEIASSHTGADSLASIVLEITYMFADMSKMFKDKQSHSALIQTAKNISEKTKDVEKYARKILENCHDPRLKQLLSCALEKLPTISHQLKIMSTLRASKLKALGENQSPQRDESNHMLITCAENLMKSIDDVVKAIASAETCKKGTALISTSKF